jgi:hypothetical protein
MELFSYRWFSGQVCTAEERRPSLTCSLKQLWSYLRSFAFICGSPKPRSVPVAAAPRCVHSWFATACRLQIGDTADWKSGSLRYKRAGQPAAAKKNRGPVLPGLDACQSKLSSDCDRHRHNHRRCRRIHDGRHRRPCALRAAWRR